MGLNPTDKKGLFERVAGYQQVVVLLAGFMIWHID